LSTRAGVSITADCSRELGELKRFEQYQTGRSSNREPETFASDISFIRSNLPSIKLLRRWVTLPSIYDPDTDTYTWVQDEQFDSLASICGGLMLTTNPAFTEADTDNGQLPVEQYRRALKTVLMHYKQRYPDQFNYWDSFNEPILGGMTDSSFYAYYRIHCEVVNEINAELSPAKPLLIGGPTPSNIFDNTMERFLTNYADDTSSTKRLDFIAFNRHNDGANPARSATYKGRIDDLLTARGLPTDIPIYVAEVSCYGGPMSSGPEHLDILRQAASDPSKWYHFMTTDGITPVTYTFRHKYNFRKNLLVHGDSCKWTARGCMIQMARRMQPTRVESDVHINSSGLGVYSLASKSDTAVTLWVWNYQWTNTGAHNVGVTVSNLPDAFTSRNVRARRYLIDSTHSTHYYPGGTGELEQVSDDVRSHAGSFGANMYLRPNSLALIVLTPTDLAPSVPHVESAHSVDMQDSTVMVTTFDMPVDSASATDLTNYSFDNGDVSVVSAHLHSDRKSVIVRVSDLTPQQGYTLTVSGVRGEGGEDSDTQQAGFVHLATPTIAELTASSGAQYELGRLVEGTLKFIDRDYVYSGVPAQYYGECLVRTANDDKLLTGDTLVSLTVDRPVTVMVLHDTRLSTKPAWLDTWTREQVSTMGRDTYSRDFDAGPIVLGGNQQEGEVANSSSNYYVLVLPREAPTGMGGVKNGPNTLRNQRPGARNDRSSVLFDLRGRRLGTMRRPREHRAAGVTVVEHNNVRKLRVHSLR